MSLCPWCEDRQHPKAERPPRRTTPCCKNEDWRGHAPGQGDRFCNGCGAWEGQPEW